MRGLTDEGFVLLGNALLLGYAAAFTLRKKAGRLSEEAELDRRERSEFRSHRAVMICAGGYDYRLEHRDGYFAEAPQSIAEHADWIIELLRQNEDITTVRLKDFDLPNELSEHYEIDEAGRSAGLPELRLPISRLTPCDLTRPYKKMATDYFRGEMPPELKVLLPEHAPSPAAVESSVSGESNEDNVSPKRRYNRGFEDTDEPFVVKGAEMVALGKMPSAAAAARYLVEGTEQVVPGEGESDRQKILSNSPQNTVNRLARKINKRLKKNEG